MLEIGPVGVVRCVEEQFVCFWSRMEVKGEVAGGGVG